LIFLPNTIPYFRPIIQINKIINLNWLVGFIDGEGYFYIKPHKYVYSINFYISQHSCD